MIDGAQLRDFTDYRVVVICGNDFVAEDEKIKDLVQDAKQNGKRRQVHALQGKRKGDPTLYYKKN